jgi:hypothetical protein
LPLQQRSPSSQPVAVGASKQKPLHANAHRWFNERTLRRALHRVNEAGLASRKALTKQAFFTKRAFFASHSVFTSYNLVVL